MSHVEPCSTGGLLGFLQGYPNPLTRLGISVGAGDKGQEQGRTDIATKGPGRTKPAVPSDCGGDMGGSQGGVDQHVVREQKKGVPVYPMSTLVVVAVIAFLLGSLARSLVSPADFVYDARGGAAGQGVWREMRRLLEVRYVFGGWDLQIAVVRRHGHA